MKICPFISHMIGDDRADVLLIDHPKAADRPRVDENSETNVVVLGYDGGNVCTATKQAASKKVDDSVPSHLFCLEGTCRFYQKDIGRCKFDSMYDDVKDQKRQFAESPDAKPDDGASAARVTKELGKFWRFQTKSVAELIASIGETDKRQEETLAALKSHIDESIEKLNSSAGQNDTDGLKNEMEKLQDAIMSREDSTENFSTTVSELVLNIDDSLKLLKEKHEALTERLEKLESSIHKMGDSHNRFGDTLTRKLNDIRTPDVSGGAESVAKKFESLIETQKQIDDRVTSWKDSVDSRLQEICEQQITWDERLEEIAGMQHEMVNLVHENQRRQRESSPFRKREARKLNNLGVTSFHNGELELARDQFLEAVALDDKSAESYNNLGLVYTELREEDKATEAFSKAIELDPDLPAAYNNLGYVLYKMGSYDRAIEMYNEALGRSTNNSPAYTNLGNAYFKRGNRTEARAAWEKALEIDPGNEKAIQNLKKLENE